MSAVTVLPRVFSKPAGYTLAHHVGNPPTSFKNPWPSAGSRPKSLLQVFKMRFFNTKNKNHVPVPADRNGLPKIITPDWGLNDKSGSSQFSMKATWIGHASFLVEMPSISSNPRSQSQDLSNDKEDTATAGKLEQSRGIRILFDPVFSSNMSPFSFGGPKRITPPPCPIEDLPEIDLVLISHDHYDHLDVTTIKYINERGQGRIRYMCGLGVRKHLVSMGVDSSHVTECDWWDGNLIEVAGLGTISVICTPSQHMSGRWWNDHGSTLWCSWVLHEGDISAPPPSSLSPSQKGKSLFFAGDTGYCSTTSPTPTSTSKSSSQSTSSSLSSSSSSLPSCPAFPQIGSLYGPFSLALLPIGCYLPREFMSAIHCAPEDSIGIHKDVQSEKSVGMHYGTVRGNISEFYEDSTEPARRWRQSCEEQGLVWGEEILVCDIGETVLA